MDSLSKEWAARAELPQHVVMMLNNFPEDLHPMTQFSAAIAALNKDSKFAKAYSEGVPKTDYWVVSKNIFSATMVKETFPNVYTDNQHNFVKKNMKVQILKWL